MSAGEVVREDLSAYKFFSAPVLDTVADATDRFSGMSSDQLIAASAIPDPKVVSRAGHAPIEVLDVRPGATNDSGEVVVFHAGMASPLNKETRYKIAFFMQICKRARIIVAGHPSRLGNNLAALNARERRRVANGDLGPVLEPLLLYEESAGIAADNHIGYSFGANCAAVAAMNARHNVAGVLAVDPGAIARQHINQLALSFWSTHTRVNGYIQKTNAAAYTELRRGGVQLLPYMLGMARPTNIAIARGLSRGGFEATVDAALSAKPALQVTVAHGSESEVTLPAPTEALLNRLQGTHGEDRVRAVRLEGDNHAMPHYLQLLGALMLQWLQPEGLRSPAERAAAAD